MNCQRLALALLAISSSAFAQPTIQTIAGSGLCGYSGDNGPASAATICNPKGITAEFNGNIYFVDSPNWRIRKIDLAGTITTVIGNGIRGTSGDGGPPLSASIGLVTDLIVGGAGICFGDQDAHKIRCLRSNGLMSGFGTGAPVSVDGPLPSASFNLVAGIEYAEQYFPPSVAYDVYAIDDNTLRRINGATGVVSTVIPPGILSSPSGIRTYNNSHIYIADGGNSRIVKYELATGTVTTVAGNGTSGYSGDGGPATAAQLQSPSQIAFDGAGNLFFTDRGNMRVRRVDAATGIISTYAGDGLSGFGADGIAPVLTQFAGLGGLIRNPVTNMLVIADGSNRLRQTPLLPASSVTLSASPNPATTTSTVTLAATVAPVTATGSAAFYDGASLIGTSPVSGGLASFAWTSPVAGSHLLRAVYLGDGATASSVSATTSLTVDTAKTNTTTSIVTNPAFPVVGQTVALIATVAPSAATGSVNFYTGSTLIGSGNLAGGQASVNVQAQTAGLTLVNLQAVYPGDLNHNGSSSASISVNVVKASTTTMVVSGLNPSTAGQSVTFTATVAPAAATGTITFVAGTLTLGTVALTGGSASLSTAAIPAGSSTVTAQYNGDANYNGGISAGLAQVVKANTATVLTATPNPSTYGQTVTLRAAISPASATGTVQFFNGATLLGTAAVSAGVGQLATSSLPAGPLSLRAQYSGDATANPSTSSNVNQTVNKANSSTTLAASATTVNRGQPVTFTATVAPAGATGQVQFKRGSTVLATVSVSSGQAVFTTSTLPNGNNSISAAYLGSANHNASQSASLNVRVR